MFYYLTHSMHSMIPQINLIQNNIFLSSNKVLTADCLYLLIKLLLFDVLTIPKSINMINLENNHILFHNRYYCFTKYSIRGDANG